MIKNTFGILLRLTTFGESHGEAIGGILDGVPPNIKLDLDFIHKELSKRRPGFSSITTTRKENDTVHFFSGLINNVTTGTPIGFHIMNTNQKSKDYSHIENVYRPSHADYTYDKKYGIRDINGGGRSSARETACRVVAGSIAKLYLRRYNITCNAFVKSIQNITINKTYNELDLKTTYSNEVRCPDQKIATEMINHIKNVKKVGDSVGGVITGVIQNIPSGIGEPIYDKLDARLAQAMLGINATKGFEIGSGFAGTQFLGSEHNDPWINDNGNIKTLSNHSGGIQGGISNGEDVYFNVAFKPTATIIKEQKTINSKNENVIVKGKGRHDPCVLPRATVIVEAMSALVIADFILMQNAYK